MLQWQQKSGLLKFWVKIGTGSFDINVSVMYKTYHTNTWHKQNYLCLVDHGAVKYE